MVSKIKIFVNINVKKAPASNNIAHNFQVYAKFHRFYYYFIIMSILKPPT